MIETVYRYPGAEPFRDTDSSRRTFFGRQADSIALTDLILANRLVIVYARSGLGKTSLLNAGVAPRLRDAGTLPLFVRVNDTVRGPLASVLDDVKAEAERQQVEFIEGQGNPLLSFFKSVEFWRGDLLVAPVLIIDQFEELFTLQPEDAREAFLSELGYLIRGVAPRSLQEADSHSNSTPLSVRVVLALREEFVGILEEAADRIPQIMDHRFRLAPLNCDAAARAITGPAAIEDPEILTRPFRLDPSCVDSILEYLTKSTPGAHTARSRTVEPFHLQLICQRIEKIVALKQEASNVEIVLTLEDLGGEAALAQTLGDFYSDAIKSVSIGPQRRAVRRLCEQYLISPEGRRLSLDERELERQLKLSGEVLKQLVKCRLLRIDPRSNGTYYELSHDALVGPVLEGSRTSALALGWASTIIGAIVSFAVGLLMAILTWALFFERSLGPGVRRGFSLLLVLLPPFGAVGVFLVRTGMRRRERYGRHDSDTSLLPTIRPLGDRLLGWGMLLAGGFLFCLFCSFACVLLWDFWRHPPEAVVGAVCLILICTVIAFGCRLSLQGVRRLWPHKIQGRSKFLLANLGHSPSLILASLKIVAGAIALTLALLGNLLFWGCAVFTEGSFPNWLRSTCGSLYANRSVDPGVLLILTLFFASAFVLSLAILRSGLRSLRSALRYRRAVSDERSLNRVKTQADLGHAHY